MLQAGGGTAQTLFTQVVQPSLAVVQSAGVIHAVPQAGGGVVDPQALGRHFPVLYIGLELVTSGMFDASQAQSVA